MKKHLKTLLFAASLVVAISASAQTEQAWSVSDSKLLPSKGAFEIVLTPNTDSKNRAVTIRINADENTITYNKSAGGVSPYPGLPLIIDLSNQSEKQSLLTLLKAYKEYAAINYEYIVCDRKSLNANNDIDVAEARQAVAKAYQSLQKAGEAFKNFRSQYQGALGQCEACPDDYREKPDEPLYFTFQNKELVLPEPTALLYTINHQAEFLQLKLAALKKKQEIELAAQQAAEAKHQAELAAAKAAEAERQKELEQKHQEELRALGYKGDLAKIQASGAEREQQRDQELQQAKQARAKEYLRTVSGFLLAGKIGNLVHEIKKLNAEESAERAGLRQTVLDDATLNKKSWSEFNRGMDAVNGDSGELMEMRADLRKLLVKFNNGCGLSYDEAWANGGESTIKTAMAIRKLVPPVIFVLVVGIFIYRAAQKDKRGMAPKWYLMGKSFIQNIKAILKEKDPEKKKALMKTFTKNSGKTSPPPDTSNTP